MNVLEIKDLSVSLSGTQVLSGIDLSLKEGEFLAVIGPNGSGKTTLLKSIINLIKPDKGEIRILGKTPSEVNADKIGYVPQIKTIDRGFPGTSLDLIVSGIKSKWPFRIRKAERESAVNVLKEMGAESIINKQIKQLSGGELQKVFLARSLIRNPKILLLDEPATGIDLVCESNINEIIESRHKENKTLIIMVTHDWTAAYHHAEKVLILNKKQIYFGKSDFAFSEENLQKAFSHIHSKHTVKFGPLKDA